MLLSDTITSEGRSEQFALYEPGTLVDGVYREGTVRYDVHVRIEPATETVSTLMVYDHQGPEFQGERYPADWVAMPAPLAQRVSAEVWKRYGKRVPAEVLA